MLRAFVRPPKRHLIIMLLTILTLLATQVRSRHVCHSIEVNSIKKFQLLRNCTIVIGHVSIINVHLPKHLEQKIASNVTEISDYLIVHRALGLTSLVHIFPKLKLIRGQGLLFEQYSLIVHENRNLEDLGLVSLLRIQKGDIRIEANPSLCFIHTINWIELLANSTRQHFWLKNNKPRQHCPRCQLQLMAAHPHCWNLNTTQASTPHHTNTKCSPDCLDGCSANDCGLCTGLTRNRKCVNFCLPAFLQLNNRECVSPHECLQLNMIPHNQLCLNACPPTYVALRNPSTGLINCNLQCHGHFVIRNRTDLLAIRDCSTIFGSLTIQLTHVKARIVEELEANLKGLKEITDYLKVVHSPQVVSLHFLRNLYTIKGDTLIDHKYAFYVVDNPHLEAIWMPTQTVAILKGQLYFHLNPRLCYEKIEQLKKSLRDPATFTIENVSRNSNGERVVCGEFVQKLIANVEDKNSTSVCIKVEPRNYEDKFVLIGYLHFYKEAPIQNVTMYDGRHGCGHDNWHMDVSPSRNVRKIITNLKPYTQYAYFVKTLTMIDYHLQRDAYSPIQYFYTLPSKPGPVAKIYYHSLTAASLQIHWWPPRRPNGRITKYILNYEEIKPNSFNRSAKNEIGAIECECALPSPELSGPIPEVENYYNKEKVIYDEAILEIVYHAQPVKVNWTQRHNSTKDPQSITRKRAIPAVPSNDSKINETKVNESNIIESKANESKINDPKAKDSKINITIQHQIFKDYQKKLVEDSLREQETDADKFKIIPPTPICDYTYATKQEQDKHHCVDSEYYKGIKIPGHVHSYILNDLKPETSYRISIRACVYGLENGCGNVATILAETVSYELNPILKRLDSYDISVNV